MELSIPPRFLSFANALQSHGPAVDRGAKMSLYDQFVGDWTIDGQLDLDGTIYKGAGEIHFSWALQGLAIQDVWIFADAFFGMTLRVYDPGLDAWHILLWSDPVIPYFARQTGRAVGPDIVQLGKNDAGEFIRWRFTEITPTSFHWIGERATPSGDYERQADFFVKRT